MHARRLAADAQKARRLRLPVAHKMRRNDDQRGRLPGNGEGRQGLNGLSKAHFIRQQRPLVGKQEGEPFLLELAQRSFERPFRRSGAKRQLSRLLAPHGMLPRGGERTLPQRPVARGNFQRIAHHQPVHLTDDAAVRGEARLAAPSFAPGKETLGHLRYAWLALDRPAFAAAVVGQRAIDMTARGRITKIARQILLPLNKIGIFHRLIL